MGRKCCRNKMDKGRQRGKENKVLNKWRVRRWEASKGEKRKEKNMGEEREKEKKEGKLREWKVRRWEGGG